MPWFPTQLYDFDHVGKTLLSEADGIQMTDHPGFNDAEYKQRRDSIVQLALDYNLGDKSIPTVKYTEEEQKTWTYCFGKLKRLYEKGACTPYNTALEKMQKNCGFSETNIPQLEDISAYLKEQTGWRVRPVGGLLTQREFLNSLAFRIFHSTQYIRHPSEPLYTPEPDIIHELMGHVPMFANQDFADFSQMIGLASLGCSDVDLPKLGTLYWFTVEFGLCMEDNKRKAYGAGILSSVGEMEFAMSDKPEILPLDCYNIAENYQDFPISSVQPTYFVAESFVDMKAKLVDYCENLSRPFNVSFDNETLSVDVDRRIRAVESGVDGLAF